MLEVTDVITSDCTDELEQCSSKEKCVHPERIGNGYLPRTLKYFYINNKKNDFRRQCKECFKSSTKQKTGFWRKLCDAAQLANKRAEPKITGVDLFWLFIAQNGICTYNGLPLVIDNMSLDHIIQVSNGGTNDIENLIWSNTNFNFGRSNKVSYEQLFYTYYTVDYKIRLEQFKNRVSIAHSNYYLLCDLYKDYLKSNKKLVFGDLANNLTVPKTLIVPY